MQPNAPQRYCIDTSSLVEAWLRRYPMENFPALWGRIEGMINGGRLVASEWVKFELEKSDDDLLMWCKGHKQFFVPSTRSIQAQASTIVNRFQRLTTGSGSANAADPFVVAAAKVYGLVVVTEEKPAETQQKLRKMPDIGYAIGETPPRQHTIGEDRGDYSRWWRAGSSFGLSRLGSASFDARRRLSRPLRSSFCPRGATRPPPTHRPIPHSPIGALHRAV
jgi:hypothetical protein